MLVALGPMAFALALLAFMPNLWTTALLLFALFFAYYVYEPPYRGLYPDLLPGVVFGRAQGVQHVFRGIAIGGALIGGGFLFHALATGAVPRRGRRHDRRLPRPDPLRDRGRRARLGVRGRPGVHRALVGGAALEPRRRDLPRGEHGLGGHLRGRAHVRRPLRHGRPRRAARHVDLHPGRRRRGVHRRRADRRPDRRPRRHRTRDHLRLGRVRRRSPHRAAWERRGTPGTSASSSSSRSPAAW